MTNTAVTISNLAAYVENSAQRFADHPAVVNSDGETLNYGELNARADQTAAFLRASGVTRGDRIGVLMPKSPTAITAMIGIIKAGAAYVPIDPTAPPERIGTILRDCRTRVVFVDGAQAEIVASETGVEHVIVSGPHAGFLGGSKQSRWEDVLHHDPGSEPKNEWTGDDLAYILYTSGSTGIPKGVMISHNNAISFIEWCASVFRVDQGDRFSSHAPFHFDLSVLDLYLSFRTGASVHLISDEMGKNPKALAAFIASRALTVWYSTPSILHLLASLGHLDRLDFSSLRLVLFAGEVFPVKHLRQLTQLWPKPQYYNLYGPTETNVCTYARIPLPIPDERTEPYPIGQPCGHCKAEVLDVEHSVPVKKGEEGVLYIAGESVFKGYWGRSMETNASFLLNEGERWYSTGDVVYEEENGFIYVGRIDRMVKRRGYRIELDDIECALYRHECIREAGVVAVKSAAGETQIVANVVADTEPRPGVLELKMFVAKVLPAYMSPDIFVFLPTLPRTATQKVDYQSLKRQFEGRTSVAQPLGS